MAAKKTNTKKKTKKVASRSAASKKSKKAATTAKRKSAPKKRKTRTKSPAKRGKPGRTKKNPTGAAAKKVVAKRVSKKAPVAPAKKPPAKKKAATATPRATPASLQAPTPAEGLALGDTREPFVLAPSAPPPAPPEVPAPPKTFADHVRDFDAGTGVWFTVAGGIEHAVIQKQGGDGAVVIRTDAGVMEVVSVSNLFETADQARTARTR